MQMSALFLPSFVLLGINASLFGVIWLWSELDGADSILYPFLYVALPIFIFSSLLTWLWLVSEKRLKGLVFKLALTYFVAAEVVIILSGAALMYFYDFLHNI